MNVSCTEFGAHLQKHGDGVKDVAFEVEDCDFLVEVTINCITHIYTHIKRAVIDKNKMFLILGHR